MDGAWLWTQTSFLEFAMTHASWADPRVRALSTELQYIKGCMRRRTVHELQKRVSQANFSRVLLVLKFTCKEKSSGTFQCHTCLGAHMSRRYTLEAVIVDGLNI